ncbi:MAG: NADP-dependent oxidoreductase [Ilumatobacter sp.]|uniref:NADP-dependent oxidoreductase n=1 Tax=Ilumatobacter sp. TaxID=1967498 RepID=UPI00391BA857
MRTNQRVVLVRRPVGTATPDCFELRKEPLVELEPGQVRVGVEYVSVDAGTRTMLRGEGFHQQVGLGDTIRSSAVGRVVETTVDDFPIGQAVRGGFGVQTLSTMPATSLTAIDDSIGPISLYLGALSGSTGVTAWIGVREIGKPAAGETFVVSAAAGAVGSVAGQIAKLDGARVIGIAGGPEKCAHLVDVLGFDEAIDHRNDDVAARLRTLCPDGIDVFFDNVGGAILDAALDNLAMHARVVICGAVSQYDDMDNVTGPSMYLRLAERQSRMEGYAYFHFPERIPTAMAQLSGWILDGSLVVPEHVLEGIERYPEALEFMFNGGNVGKLLVKVGSMVGSMVGSDDPA